MLFDYLHPISRVGYSVCFVLIGIDEEIAALGIIDLICPRAVQRQNRYEILPIALKIQLTVSDGEYDIPAAERLPRAILEPYPVYALLRPV